MPPGYAAPAGYTAPPGYGAPPGYTAPPGYAAPPGYGPPPPPGYGPAPQYGPYGGYGPPGYLPPPGYPGWPAQAGAGAFAGFWIRLGAYILDALPFWIVGLILFPPQRTASTVILQDGTAVTTHWVTFRAGMLLPALVMLIYFAVCWGAYGRTLGQRALGLRVVDADTGGPIGPARGVLRALGFLVASLPLLIGLIWAAFDPRKQGWHDKVASTVVVTSR